MSELKNYFKSYFDKMIRKIGDDSEGERLLKKFYDDFNNKEVNYDISGFSLIFMIPPDLSGYFKIYDGMENKIEEICSKTLYLSLDISVPESTMTASELSSGSSSKLPYAQFRTTGGNFSISFFDIYSLDIYYLISTWLNYMTDVISGDVCPDSKYITGEEAGAIDYASAIYFIKLKPFSKDITYIGKATGVFPLNLPNRDILGGRTTNQLSVFPVQFICSDYNELILEHKKRDRNSWIEGEFINDLKKYIN